MKHSSPKFSGTFCLWLLTVTSLAQTAPHVFTQAAGPITTNTATITGMAVPNGLPTMAWFEWGTNSFLDHSTSPVDLGAGSQVVHLKAELVGLEAAGVVCFRLVASNQLSVVCGTTNRFTPRGVPVWWGDGSGGALNVPLDMGYPVALGCGVNHMLAIKPDGTVTAWGYNRYGQTNVPPGLNNVIAAAGGFENSLALKADGTVIGWGSYGTPLPAPTNMVAIAAGMSFSAGLTGDGTVRTWGAALAQWPTGLSNVVAIAAGYYFALALKADGTVYGWGDNDYGQCSAATNLTNIVAISAGAYHALALRKDGTIIAWGLNDSGQTNVPPGLGDVVAIGGGDYFSAALRTDGSVVAWGSNSYGRTKPPTGLTNVVALSVALAGHGFVLRAQTAEDIQPAAATQPAGPVTLNSATLNGMVLPAGYPTTAWFEWGTNGTFSETSPPQEAGSGFYVIRMALPLTNLTPNKSWQFRIRATNVLGCAVGSTRYFTTGGKLTAWGTSLISQGAIPTTPDFVGVSAGQSNCFGLRADGTVTGWGANINSSLTIPSGLSNVIALSSRAYGTMALKNNGLVTNWGNIAIAPPKTLSNVLGIASGSFHGLALKNDGTVAAWGTSASGQTTVPGGLRNVTAIAAGHSHSVALSARGSVSAWGLNSSGQCDVPADSGRVIAIAAGAYHTLALRSDGGVIAWGQNDMGQTNVPAGLSNVVEIAAGDTHSVAVKSDGAVVAWGNNNRGQCTVPSALSSAVAIAGGGEHSAVVRALTTDDFRPLAYTQTAWPKGPGSHILHGAVSPQGLPTAAWFEWWSSSNLVQKSDPVSLGDAFGAVHVSTPLSGLPARTDFWYRTVASNAVAVVYGNPQRLTTGRRVAAWGNNTYGQTSLPHGLDDVVTIATGEYHGLALRANGTVEAWGKHYPSSSPQPPAGLEGVVALAGGQSHSVALKSDGSVVAWGMTDTTPAITNFPANLTNVIAIAAANSFIMALRDDGTVTVWGRNFTDAQLPAGLRDVVAIDCSASHCLALKLDGTVAAWLDNSSWNPKPPAGLNGVAAIGAGYSYSYAIRTNGTVVGWNSCSIPPDLTNVIAVTGGNDDMAALFDDGSLKMWYRTGYLIPPRAPAPVGLSNSVAITSGYYFHMALGPNVPPQARSLSVTGAVSKELVIPLPVQDPNGDQVNIRISSLPAAGSLFQYTSSGAGAGITSPGTVIEDPEGRVIFIPAAGTSGMPYASFQFAGSDGELDSPIETLTVNILPSPMLSGSSLKVDSNGVSVSFSFDGLTNATYSIWATTNLATWNYLRTATQSTPGLFFFSDQVTTNHPMHFYRVSSP